MPAERFHLSQQESPIGTMLLVVDDAERLRVLDWTDHRPRLTALLRRYYGADGVGYRLESHDPPGSVRLALQHYFAGVLTALDTLPVAMPGTGFQRQVWTALRTIPAGRTESYAALATRIGRPTAVRAVGAANGANPVGIVVPCHRVIGKDASLTGYGGGLERKRWLLAHEGVGLAFDRLGRSVR